MSFEHTFHLDCNSISLLCKRSAGNTLVKATQKGDVVAGNGFWLFGCGAFGRYGQVRNAFDNAWQASGDAGWDSASTAMKSASAPIS